MLFHAGHVSCLEGQQFLQMAAYLNRCLDPGTLPGLGNLGAILVGSLPCNFYIHCCIALQKTLGMLLGSMQSLLMAKFAMSITAQNLLWPSMASKFGTDLLLVSIGGVIATLQDLDSPQ